MIDPTKTELTDEDRQRISAAIEKREDEIAAIEWDLMNDSVGVLQAQDLLRKALDETVELLKKDHYERATALGYSDVTSNFVFLQRTMGCLNMNAMKKRGVIQDVALETLLAYELVEPQVNAAFKKSLDDTIAKHREEREGMLPPDRGKRGQTEKRGR